MFLLFPGPDSSLRGEREARLLAPDIEARSKMQQYLSIPVTQEGRFPKANLKWLWWVFPIPIKQLLDTSWESYNSTQFWPNYPEKISDSIGWGLSPTRLTPLHMPVPSPRCYLDFRWSSYWLEVPMTPLGVWLISWRGLQSSGNLFTH